MLDDGPFQQPAVNALFDYDYYAFDEGFKGLTGRNIKGAQGTCRNGGTVFMHDIARLSIAATDGKSPNFIAAQPECVYTKAITWTMDSE